MACNFSYLALNSCFFSCICNGLDSFPQRKSYCSDNSSILLHDSNICYRNASKFWLNLASLASSSFFFFLPHSISSFCFHYPKPDNKSNFLKTSILYSPISIFRNNCGNSSWSYRFWGAFQFLFVYRNGSYKCWVDVKITIKRVNLEGFNGQFLWFVYKNVYCA